MAVQHYRELIAWQKAMDLMLAVYGATNRFPPNEQFGLTNQVRRATVSIPSNIPEGQGRSTTKDFIHFLYVARGSLQEVETQITIAQRLDYFEDDGHTPLLARCQELSRILNGLIRSLNPADH